jgi:hypothetical protein
MMMLLLTLALAGSSNAPLPKMEELRKRAIATEERTAELQERYSCRLHAENIETDSKGKPKKTEITEQEEFFVNGHPIHRTLTKNGKPLSESESKKEDDHVLKEVKKYSDPKNMQKEKDEQRKEIEAALRVLKMSNERRIDNNGRDAIAMSIEGDPKAPAHDLHERFMQAMNGQLVLDETTGELVDLNIRSVRDVKIGGGLLANLHKGFWLHVHQTPQTDGVWLTDMVEGSGDARAALFLHPYFQFKEARESCHLYNVDINTGAVTPVSPVSKK